MNIVVNYTNSWKKGMKLLSVKCKMLHTFVCLFSFFMISSINAQSQPILLYINNVLQTTTYLTIDSAVNGVGQTQNLPTNLSYKIVIPPGLYQEYVQINYICKPLLLTSYFNEADMNTLHYISETTIDGGSLNPVFNIVGCQAKVSLEGMSITNGKGFLEQSEYYNTTNGGGVITGDCYDLSIRWCRIFHNEASYGAGILSLNNDNFELANCEVFDNKFDHETILPARSEMTGGGLCISAENNIVITGCKIYSNGLDPELIYGYNSSGGGMKLNGRIVEVTNTLIYGNISSVRGSAITCEYPGLAQASSALIDNCTIVNNHSISNYDSRNALYFYRENGNVGADVLITNSIIKDNTMGTSSDICTYSIAPYDVDLFYCCTDRFGDTYQNEYEYTNINTNYYTDPLFVDEVNHDYSLKWDTTDKSPCIDSANPDADGDGITWYSDASDRDADGSQMDMGAVPLLDGHIHSTQKFTNANHQIKYCSFPGVVNCVGRENENTFDYVFNTFRGNNLFITGDDRVLDNLQWSYNQNTGQATAGTPPNVHLYSQYGFKVQLVSGSPIEKTIEYTGYHSLDELNIGMPVPELNNARIGDHYVKAPVHANQENCKQDSVTGVWYRKIFLGYDLDVSMNPTTAYAAIWDKCISIRAGNWSTDRIPTGGPYNPNDPLSNYTKTWTSGRIASMAPGGMLEVWYIDNADTQFKLGEPASKNNGETGFDDSYEWQMPQHFSYSEEMEYVPMYLTLDLSSYPVNERPEEIAVYVGDECKGAAVIDGDRVDIQAYITNIPDEQLQNLEFRYYFPSKGSATAPKYAIMNAHTGQYDMTNITTAGHPRYLQIKLGSGSDVTIPAVTTLKGNYPNPFNPKTSIRFDLAKSGNVKLEVFNVKGQLVKTLVNGKSEAGSHALEWNGLDNNGKATSSGVYYYKLTTDGKTLTNKMLMLK